MRTLLALLLVGALSACSPPVPTTTSALSGIVARRLAPQGVVSISIAPSSPDHWLGTATKSNGQVLDLQIAVDGQWCNLTVESNELTTEPASPDPAVRSQLPVAASATSTTHFERFSLAP